MDYSIKPKEHELTQARQAVEKALEGAKYVVEKDEDLSVNLGYASSDEAGEFGVFGSAISPGEVEIFFNSSIDEWKDNLQDLTADLYGQAWFYENSEVTFIWQQVLASITGLIVIETFSERQEVDVEELKEEWTEKKTGISDKVSERPENLSWQLKTAIGHQLLEEYEIGDLPDLNRSDVLDAGDTLFK